MQLSDEQGSAVKKIKQWLSGNGAQRFVLAGYAGSGKTTIARYLSGDIGHGVHFLAFTGKAANVLREKGCPNTSTIHSAIYTRVEDERTGEVSWILDHESPICSARLVVVDEYSMIPKDLREDLEKLAPRILYLGDPFQLPPVKGQCDIEPDLMLQEVHRQAFDSHIIRIATQVRIDEILHKAQVNYILHDDMQYISAAKSRENPDIFTNADQILVGYNRTRLGFNNRFRERLGHSEKGVFPQAGEKVICLRNNRELKIFNGQIEVLEEAANERKDGETVDFVFGGQRIQAWRQPFIGEDVPKHYDQRECELFDYAYAITTHKSQGSEWDNVVIYNQPIGNDQREKARWIYTALTRAKKKCVLIEP